MRFYFACEDDRVTHIVSDGPGGDLMLDNGLMNMMRVNAADRRTLLVAMMMAEGVESRVVDLVRTGREKLILVAGPATPRTPGHVAR